MSKLDNLNKIAKEICHREQSKGREVNITEVKRVLRHLSDILAEDWKARSLSKVEMFIKRGMSRLK